jgi:hypothetical protein
MHHTHTIENQKNSVLNNFSLVVAQKQLAKLLTIQKTHLQQHKNPSPNIENKNTCIKKKQNKTMF